MGRDGGIFAVVFWILRLDERWTQDSVHGVDPSGVLPLVSRGGLVYGYGDAAWRAISGVAASHRGMQTSPSGNGYWLLSDTGVVVGFGDVASSASRLPGSATPLVGVSPK